jgi:lipid II:glycine glycyltransferase (peptidoglycan interpeptide bridge formation enzyme)
MPDHVNHDTTRTRNQLRAMGWRQPDEDEEGFAAGQPRFVFQLPIAGRTPDQLLGGMNQLWRRNIKKAAKAGSRFIKRPLINSRVPSALRRDC